MQEKQRAFLVRTAYWAVWAVLLWLGVRYLLRWLLPFLLALALAAAVEPVIAWCRRRMGLKRGFTAAVVTIAVTGAIDLVSDGQRCFVIRNGRPEMGKITGTGCQLSGMMTAFVVANPDRRLEAAAAAVCAMGLAGETGWSRMAPGDGNSTYRNRIIDAIYNMDGAALDKGAKYEVR